MQTRFIQLPKLQTRVGGTAPKVTFLQLVKTLDKITHIFINKSLLKPFWMSSFSQPQLNPKPHFKRGVCKLTPLRKSEVSAGRLAQLPAPVLARQFRLLHPVCFYPRFSSFTSFFCICTPDFVEVLVFLIMQEIFCNHEKLINHKSSCRSWAFSFHV